MAEMMRVINPATEESIEEIRVSSREDIDGVVDLARRHRLDDPQVEAVGPAAGPLDRAELFHDLARNLRDHADELAEIMTHEGGKPFIENHDEVGWTAACFDYYGEIARDSVGYLPSPI